MLKNLDVESFRMIMSHCEPVALARLGSTSLHLELRVRVLLRSTVARVAARDCYGATPQIDDPLQKLCHVERRAGGGQEKKARTLQTLKLPQAADMKKSGIDIAALSRDIAETVMLHCDSVAIGMLRMTSRHLVRRLCPNTQAMAQKIARNNRLEALDVDMSAMRVLSIYRIGGKLRLDCKEAAIVKRVRFVGDAITRGCCDMAPVKKALTWLQKNAEFGEQIYRSGGFKVCEMAMGSVDSDVSMSALRVVAMCVMRMDSCVVNKAVTPVHMKRASVLMKQAMGLACLSLGRLQRLAIERLLDASALIACCVQIAEMREVAIGTGAVSVAYDCLVWLISHGSEIWQESMASTVARLGCNCINTAAYILEPGRMANSVEKAEGLCLLVERIWLSSAVSEKAQGRIIKSSKRLLGMP